MAATSDSAISEILKLYNMVDVHKISNTVQLTNVLELTNVFESEIANMESSCSNSLVKEFHQPLKLPDNAKESCIEPFRQLHSHLKLLLERPGSMGGYERAFSALFGQDVHAFTGTMILNLDQLEHQLDKEEFHEIGSMDALQVIKRQHQSFIESRFTEDYEFDSQMTEKSFAEYSGMEVDMFRVTLLQLMGDVMEHVEERAKHKMKYDDKVKAHRVQSSDGIAYLGKVSDVGSVITECKGSESDKIDTTGNLVPCATHDIDAEFRPINEQESCAEVPLTYQHNGLSKEWQHTDHIKPSYDTNLLEKTDSNAISN